MKDINIKISTRKIKSRKRSIGFEELYVDKFRIEYRWGKEEPNNKLYRGISFIPLGSDDPYNNASWCNFNRNVKFFTV